MRFIIFCSTLFKQYPLLFLSWTGLLILQGIFAGASVLTIAPIVDKLISDRGQISAVTQKFIDICLQLEIAPTLETFVLIFLTFLVFKNGFLILANYLMYSIKFSVMGNLGINSHKKFFQAHWLFFSQSQRGTLLNTFTREISSIGDSLGHMSSFFASLVQFIIFLSVPMLISWKSTLICLSLGLIFAFPFIFLNRITYRIGQAVTSTSNQLSNVIHENIDSAKVILGFGKQTQNIKRYAKAFEAHRKVGIKSQMLDQTPHFIFEPLSILALVITLFIVQKMSIVLADMAIVLWGLKSAIPLVIRLITQRNSVEGLMPSYEQVISLQEEAESFKQKSGDKQFIKLTDSLLLKNVCFTYPKREQTLKNITLSISKGQKIAFVGESGGGKSTLIDILMGFYSPDQGSILLDGIPLEEYDIQSYREQIGYIPQDTILFNMSVRDNLLWSKQNATEEELWEACHQANAETFIKALPEGLETLVGDRGVRLSGGQAQRLSLARAILRKPSLLILDEATSALDSKSEKLIQETIENISQETTIIAVAHRLSTIIHFDTIYVIKEGRIEEAGTYQQLSIQNGQLTKMAELQSLL